MKDGCWAKKKGERRESIQIVDKGQVWQTSCPVTRGESSTQALCFLLPTPRLEQLPRLTVPQCCICSFACLAGNHLISLFKFSFRN